MCLVLYVEDFADVDKVGVFVLQGSGMAAPAGVETMIALGLEDHVTASYGLDNPVKEEWEAGFAKMNHWQSHPSSRLQWPVPCPLR